MEIKKSTLATLSAFLANLIFGFSFIFSKMALNVTDVFVLLAWRFLIAFVLMLVVVALKIQKVNYKGKKISQVVLLAILQPFLYFIFEQYGILMTTTAFSGVLLATVPVVVMAISGVLLKEKTTFMQIVFGIISLVGVSLISVISNREGNTTTLGVIMLILAVISAALFNVISRKISKDFTPFERTFAMFFVALLGFFAIGLFRYKTSFFTMMADAIKMSDFRISLIYLSVFSSVIAFLIYNFATTYISVVRASAFSNIITVVSVLAGIFILGEDLTMVELSLCALIVIGVIGVNFFGIKKNDKKFEKNS